MKTYLISISKSNISLINSQYFAAQYVLNVFNMNHLTKYNLKTFIYFFAKIMEYIVNIFYPKNDSRKIINYAKMSFLYFFKISWTIIYNVILSTFIWLCLTFKNFWFLYSYINHLVQIQFVQGVQLVHLAK